MAKNTKLIADLTCALSVARSRFFSHEDAGNLTPAQKRAFDYTNMAYLLLFQAAQIELDAETEMQTLLAAERAAHLRREEFA